MSHARVTRPGAPRGAALAILACTVWAARVSPARAEEAAPDAGETIGVLEVATYGVSQAAGDKFEQSVEETLTAVGLRVVRSHEVQKQLAGTNYISGCTFGPCMKEVLTRTGLRRVLVARIQGAGQTYSVVVSLIDTESGHLVSQVAQSCPVCTVEDAIATSIKAVVKLLTEEDATSAESAASLAPGGAAAEEGEAAAPDEEAAERRQQRMRRLGWTFVASGAIALGLGGTLIALDSDGAGLASAGLGVGLTAAGLTAFSWSRSF
jgi:hypothetical protein